VTFQRSLKRGPISRTIHKKLGLPDSPGCASVATKHIVDLEALLSRQRQSALLTIAVRRLSRPRLLRQRRGALYPVIYWESVAWKSIAKIFRLVWLRNGMHNLPPRRWVNGFR